MNFKKILVLILVTIMAVNFSGCKGSPDSSSSEQITTQVNTKRDYITLLYSSADTVNPYTASTEINRQLCKLLYEPLVKLDNEFKAVYSIAESAVTQDNKCTVKIRNVKFSDSSAVTADDVVYSYNLAKESTSVYSAKLYEVTSVSASDSATVVFNLTKNDPYFVNLLTFPILKAGSENVTDSDSVLQPPIGSGRYKVDESRTALIWNEQYYGKKGNISKIKLINAPDSESVEHYAQVGAADMYYSDISDGKILRMSGQKVDVNLNSLVYIGINQNYGALEQNYLRQAISSGIDRNKICRNAYYNNAVSAKGFFSPAWNEVKSVQNIQIEAKSQITVENLEKIGYNILNDSGQRVNSNGTPLKFTMLVNSENRIRASAAGVIASQLLDYGIVIKVIEKPYEQYIESLRSGNFQLFLGEVKLTENMDISPLVSNDSDIAFGLSKKNETTDGTQDGQVSNKSQEVVNGFYSGANTIEDVASVLQSEMPFVPVCYRTGVLFYNDHIENVNNCSESDIYFSIESYIYN